MFTCARFTLRSVFEYLHCVHVHVHLHVYMYTYMYTVDLSLLLYYTGQWVCS